ncbi:type II secretion system major pseudopilin GspG [Novosphingobium sp. FKTRR1]|uniref:type II secretion system major pseudopilin GspG n=1 Tax=Novosphingobium sp. FKTRR1 TaxID=2879118 RepID=UPI001CF09DAD|nr:type II secretion system major pseudopilin GspG [Novosphingobium sp. FKTRR1]
MPAHPSSARTRSSDAGFSLIELMVVIFIIGLLATVVLINVLPSQDKAMVVKARSDLATLAQALEMYRLDQGSYPDQAQGLGALKVAPANLPMPQGYRPGGYVKALPTDPWGHAYQYQVPGPDGHAYDLFSLGADGRPGGADLKADIHDDGG